MNTNFTSHAISFLALCGMLSPALAQTYDYDAAGRLLRAAYKEGESIRYSYDAADNILAVSSSTITPAPMTISSVRSAPGEASVSWTGAGGATGFIVERRVAGSTRWVEVASVGANVNSFTDRALTPGVSYEYRVASLSGAGQSAYSETATAKVFGTPTVYNGGVVNGASFGQHEAVAPGSIVSIFGNAIGFTVTGNTLSPSSAQAPSIPLPTTLNGITALFEGVEAPLYFVGGQPPEQGTNGQLIYNGQINAQVPWEMLGKGLVEVVLRANTANGILFSEPVYVEVAPVSPAVFTFDFGGGRAAALNVKLDPNDGVVDASPAQPEGAIPGRESQPAVLGGIITVYCNGLGELNPPIESGHDSLDALRHAVSPVKVYIGGVEATVDFAGLAPQFVGLYQINVFVPNSITPGPEVTLVLEQNGIRSREDVTIAVRAP